MAAKGTFFVLATLISLGMAGRSEAAHVHSRNVVAQAQHLHADIELLEREIQHNLRGPYFTALISSANAMCNAAATLEEGLLHGAEPRFLLAQAETIERLACSSATLAQQAAYSGIGHHHGHYGHQHVRTARAVRLLAEIESSAHCLATDLARLGRPVAPPPVIGRPAIPVRPGFGGSSVQAYRAGNHVGVQVRTPGFSIRFGR